MSPRSSAPNPAALHRAAREPQPVNPLLLAAVVAVVLGVATVGVSWLTSPGLLLATLATVGAVAVLTQRLVQSQKPHHWETKLLDVDAERGSDSRVATLRHQVELAAKGSPEGQQRLHALLTELTADRLRDRHGLEPDDPEGRALLGPDLTAYLAGPPRGRLTTDDLHRHVQKLEELS
ncbi:hypothetical protein SAMN05216199_2079 [Pedococcus cremeus]|uniref:Uncharacterized protein n=1 Tax=Pedococcus cremeus TaxID=587636 RepID=A0A1H9USA3_9MICO|nr:hypothetical protein [Pedococcus cremeus]SES12221.1 hypothetical protein SAMN05216199_2079 [Pedococcus cremeus]